MHPSFRFFMPWISLLLLLSLSACGGRPKAVFTELEDKDPVDQLIRLEQDLEVARQARLDVLSPNNFANAEALFLEAQSLLKRERDLSEILLKITTGRVELQRAEQTAQIAHAVLPDVIKVRELALSAGAAELGQDFLAAEERFLRLTRAIEANNLDLAQRDKAKVFNAFDQLELRAIKERYLGETRRQLEQIMTNRAVRQTPLALAEAQKKLDEADAYINNRRYQSEDIRRKADQALFFTRRLQQVLVSTEMLRSQAPEQNVLFIEGLLHQTAEQLNLSDQRDRPFEGQMEGILTAIASNQQQGQDQLLEIAALESTIIELQQRIATLEGTTLEERAARQQLAEERRFQRLFSQVQDLFSAEEADVYKQEDRLIIRLKTMNFAVGQSVIEVQNYPLLSKVQQAIALFGLPRAIIEGHTDSTGSAQTNLALSLQRAEAVRSYLIANGTLPEEKIEAIGYGSSRPLASDLTAEGRAMNRRIDVVLIPVAP